MRGAAQLALERLSAGTAMTDRRLPGARPELLRARRREVDLFWEAPSRARRHLPGGATVFWVPKVDRI
jgi:hypothetical protein